MVDFSTETLVKRDDIAGRAKLLFELELRNPNETKVQLSMSKKIQETL